ncbi:Protein phosphatase 1 regulatory subunit 3D [Camelus dromedarius]|uniref:Protein phosphatase 1 regulatory subunit 3D n=1 Tax=Camelus dromedarius TaxID=9838 RepID=A0A5N4CW64_CAMDR|nr:Protein phosphatase 1 regulatory subunit 3D [Camelus dromedarius]
MALEKQVAVHYNLLGLVQPGRGEARWHSPWRRGHLDVFAFGFPVLPFLLQFSFHLHFALRCRVASAEYWDNHLGGDCSLT